MRSCTWMAAVAAGLILPGLLAAPRVAWAASSKNVAYVETTPHGATLRTGDTVQFTAEALNKKRDPIPGVRIRWSSNLTRVAHISSGGLVTARQQGVATLTARAGSKKTTFRVAVVAPATETLATAAAGLDQVNHVVADADNVYWTEINKKQVKVRRASVNGGAITDLAVQVYKDSRQLKYSAVHVKLSGDYVYWSRQSVGFEQHWAIFRVPKAGGTIQRVLTEDISVKPLLATGWQVQGKYVVVAVARPEELGLSENTRVASFDTETRVWSALLTQTFPQGQVAVIAADQNFVYLRGITNNDVTRLIRVSPSDGETSALTLVSVDSVDKDVTQVAASDGTSLYFWSRVGSGSHKLMKVNVDGNTGAAALLNGNFGSGLITSGGNLYWARDNTALVRFPTAGGATPTQLQSGLFGTPSLGGLAQNAQRVFFVKKQGKRYTILGLTK